MPQDRIFIQTSIGLFMLAGLLDNIRISEFEGQMEFQITTQDQHYYEFPEPIVLSVWEVRAGYIDDQYNRPFCYQRQVGAAGAAVVRSNPQE